MNRRAFCKMCIVTLVTCYPCAAQPPIHIDGPHLDRMWQREVARTRRDFGRFPERADALREHLTNLHVNRRGFLPILRAPYRRREWGVVQAPLVPLRKERDVTLVYPEGSPHHVLAVRDLSGYDGTPVRIDYPLLVVGDYDGSDYTSQPVPLLQRLSIRRYFTETPSCHPVRHLVLSVRQ